MSSPSGRIAVAVVMASAVVLGACRVTGPTPLAPNLLLDFEEPVIARFVSATGVFIAEFPVTVSDPHGQGGRLALVEAVVFNRSRGSVVGSNRRPNVSHPFAEADVPAGGSLTVAAGVGFEPPPPRDELVITVRVRLTDDREVVRTSALHQQF